MNMNLLKDVWVGMLEAILRAGMKEVPKSLQNRAHASLEALSIERKRRHLPEMLLTLKAPTAYDNPEDWEAPPPLSIDNLDDKDLAVWHFVMEGISRYDWRLGLGVKDYFSEVTTQVDDEFGYRGVNPEELVDPDEL